MINVLVTGANGFVGSHVIEALMGEASVNVIAACRDHKKILPSFTGEVRQGDLRDARYLDELFHGVDVLVNAAAWSSAWGHERDSNKYFLAPTLHLIEKAIASGITRIVNVSSVSAAAPDNSEDPMSEGIKRRRWPHLNNVIEIENRLRHVASATGLSVINLRFGVFVGQRYGIGLLPILLPRLKTHLVPWVSGGRTSIPIVDGWDVGQAVRLACLKQGLRGYESFNVVGPSHPTAQELIEFIHAEFAYPKPHFSVPFSLAYPFAWLMEKLDPLVPWEPLVTRSIVHLLEETNANNLRAEKLLAYRPSVDWKTSVRNQILDMEKSQLRPMSMVKPIVD